MRSTCYAFAVGSDGAALRHLHCPSRPGPVPPQGGIGPNRIDVPLMLLEPLCC
jgi:hypothetical protein